MKQIKVSLAIVYLMDFDVVREWVSLVHVNKRQFSEGNYRNRVNESIIQGSLLTEFRNLFLNF